MFGLIAVLSAAAYMVLNKKDKVLESLEKEYSELVTSEQYKVKGQY